MELPGLNVVAARLAEQPPTLRGFIGGVKAAAEFDPTKTTQELFTVANGAEAVELGASMLSHSPIFAAARVLLDHSYHGVYCVERQEVQDRIICAILERGGLTLEQADESGGTAAAAGDHEDDDGSPIHATPSDGSIASSKDSSGGSDCAGSPLPVCPWAVWTAGAMGAGKGHTMRLLKQAASIFPSQAFVGIDPDEIKAVLPETPLYKEHNHPHASTMVHRESTLIAEVCERVAFAIGANLIVDGSLRDQEWYTGLFARYRKQYPAYRLAIIHVDAPPEVVRRRARERALMTGRSVPLSVLEAALAQVPPSVEALTPLVDLSVTIENADDESPPIFKEPWTCLRFSRQWDAVRGAWAERLCAELIAEANMRCEAEPVFCDEAAELACRKESRRANALAHAAARLVDGGTAPARCCSSDPLSRRVPLEAMPSMLSLLQAEALTSQAAADGVSGASTPASTTSDTKAAPRVTGSSSGVEGSSTDAKLDWSDAARGSSPRGPRPPNVEAECAPFLMDSPSCSICLASLAASLSASAAAAVKGAAVATATVAATASAVSAATVTAGGGCPLVNWAGLAAAAAAGYAAGVDTHTVAAASAADAADRKSVV